MSAKWVRLAAINLALLLVLAAAVELRFGGWRSRDPLDELSLPRDLRMVVDASGLYPGGAAFPYVRDHWGLRGGGTDPAKVTILTLGSSTTNQLYIPEDQTWQKVLEQGFRADGTEVVVANAGIDGQSTIGNLVAMERWLPHVPALKPRFVLAFVGIADTNITGSWIDGMVHPSPLRRLEQKSAILRATRNLVGMVTTPRAKLKHQAVDFAALQWTDKPGHPGRHDRDAELDQYKQRLSLLAQRIHAMGAVPIFVTHQRGDYRQAEGKTMGVAVAGGPNGIDQYRLLAAFNQATREVCEDDGLLCLDLARELTFDKGDFYDYLHNTPAGAAKIGRWLHGKLAGLV